MAYQENNIKPLPPKQQFGGEGALGLVSGVLGRAVKVAPKIVGAFANAAKQYLKGFKKPAVNQQTTRNIKPFHRDGKTFSRKDIEDAFRRGL